MIINGTLASFQESELALLIGNQAAEVFADIHDMTYADGRDPQSVPGAGGVILGSTRGLYKAENGTMAMYHRRARDYLTKLQSLAPPGAGPCDILQKLKVTYRIPGDPRTDTDIVQFRLMNAGDGGKATESGAIVTTFKTFVISVSRNGVML